MHAKKGKSLAIALVIIIASSSLILINASNEQSSEIELPRPFFEVTDSINVQYPGKLVYDSGNGLVFVCNGTYGMGDNASSTDTIEVISENTHEVIASIPIADALGNLVYASGKGEIYVTCLGSGNINVISDTNYSIVDTIKIGGMLGGITYDSGKGEIFVASFSLSEAKSTIFVISDSTHTVVDTIPIPININSELAYDSSTGNIFLTNYFAATVTIISDSTNSIIKTIKLRDGPEWPDAIVYDSGKNEVFVATDGNPKVVAVISNNSYSVVANISGGNSPHGMTYDSRRGLIFVAYAADYEIRVISDSNNSIVSTFRVNEHYDDDWYPRSIACANNGEVFVANYSSVLVLSEASSPPSSPSPNLPEIHVVLVLSVAVALLSVILLKKWTIKQQTSHHSIT
jgi:hypothetical protein